MPEPRLALPRRGGSHDREAEQVIKAGAKGRLSLAKKTLKNLTGRDSSVRGGRIGVYLPTDSCVIKLGCPKG